MEGKLTTTQQAEVKQHPQWAARVFAQEGSGDREEVENKGDFTDDRIGALEVTVESLEVWGRAGDLN